MGWSLEKEICQAANTDNFNLALLQLGLIKSVESPFTLREDTKWIRGGAETYIYRFWIKEEEGEESAYIIKACVPYSPTNDINQILSEWLSRRQVLSDFGISTPELISYGKGIIIEEYITYVLRDLLLAGIKQDVFPLDERLVQLAIYTGAIYSKGFSAIEPFEDLRSRGNDVVVIDFGEDLGPAHNKPVHSKQATFDLMIYKLRDWGVNLNPKMQSAMRGIFDASINTEDVSHS